MRMLKSKVWMPLLAIALSASCISQSSIAKEHATTAHSSPTLDGPSVNRGKDPTGTKGVLQKDAPKCLEAKFDKLRAQWGGIQHRALYATTNYIGAGSRILVALSGPVPFPPGYTGSKSMADIDFRSFIVKSGEGPAYATPPNHAYDAIEGDASLNQDSLPHSIADKLGLESQKNYVIQVDIPRSASKHMFWQARYLVLVGCVAGPNAAIFWAETPIELTPLETPIVAAILSVIALYLSATTWVYFARKRDERASKEEHDIKLSQMFRLEPIKKWSWCRCLDPVVITSDVFDRGSLAKLQILFFVLLVAYGLVFIILRTGELSSISPTVVYLLGISAFGALGTKVAATSRDRLSSDNWAWLVSRGVLPINDPGKDDRPRWTDLVMSDAELDIYKLQAFVFSGVVGFAMIAGGFSLATFSVPQELLEILGLSQVVFVGGRLAKPATMGDLDDLITDLRKRLAELQRAAVSGIDVDADGKPTTDAKGNLLDPAKDFPFRDLSAARQNVPNAVRRYVDAANQVNVLLESLSHRIVRTAILLNPELDG